MPVELGQFFEVGVVSHADRDFSTVSFLGANEAVRSQGWDQDDVWSKTIKPFAKPIPLGINHGLSGIAGQGDPEGLEAAVSLTGWADELDTHADVAQMLRQILIVGADSVSTRKRIGNDRDTKRRKCLPRKQGQMGLCFQHDDWTPGASDESEIAEVVTPDSHET